MSAHASRASREVRIESAKYGIAALPEAFDQTGLRVHTLNTAITSQIV